MTLEITYSEMFLIVWAVCMTIMYLITRSNAEDFRKHTLAKLMQVYKGEARIVFEETDEGYHISIVNKE